MVVMELGLCIATTVVEEMSKYVSESEKCKSMDLSTVQLYVVVTCILEPNNQLQH